MKKIILIILILSVFQVLPFEAIGDSPSDIPVLLQIELKVDDETLTYSVSNTIFCKHLFEKRLKELFTISKEDKLPVVQINLSKGSREVTASELIEFMDLLQKIGFESISFYKPKRVGILLKKQPVIIPSPSKEKKKK